MSILINGKLRNYSSLVTRRRPHRHHDHYAVRRLLLYLELHRDAVDPPDPQAADKITEMKLTGIAFSRVSRPIPRLRESFGKPRRGADGVAGAGPRPHRLAPLPAFRHGRVQLRRQFRVHHLRFQIPNGQFQMMILMPLSSPSLTTTSTRPARRTYRLCLTTRTWRSTLLGPTWLKRLPPRPG